MFPRKLFSIGVVLIVISALAGSMFRIGLIEQFISLAEPMVHRKSHAATLGWTVNDFRKLCSSFGPEVEIVSETFATDNTSILTFRNGNSLRLGHAIFKDNAVRTAYLYSNHSDQDLDTMAQIALLICATTDEKSIYREVCHDFIDEASCCVFGRPGKSIHARYIQKEGLIYQASLSTNTVNFWIHPNSIPSNSGSLSGHGPFQFLHKPSSNW